MVFTPFQGFEEWCALICGFGDEASEGCYSSGKALDVHLCLRHLHVDYGLNFIGVCFDTPLADHETEESPGRYAEGALRWVESHSVILQDAEHER
ncbi:hypothetical protein ACE6H2_016425 [Prunus campanulata]